MVRKLPECFWTAEGCLLAYPDPTRPFILDADASDAGIGASLVTGG